MIYVLLLAVYEVVAFRQERRRVLAVLLYFLEEEGLVTSRALGGLQSYRRTT